LTWNIPNILTVFRLIAAPMVPVMFLYFNRPYADWFALALFLGAGLTDFFDGYLARKWNQVTKFGRMLDPIADKAMVVIALAVLMALYGLAPWILLPASVIIFREVFVSGLREFIGADASKLQVTKLAKWKTTAQMLAIGVLFAKGVFEHKFTERLEGMDANFVDQLLSGEVEDMLGINRLSMWNDICYQFGGWMLAFAAILTLISGADYLIKAMPFLRDEQS